MSTLWRSALVALLVVVSVVGVGVPSAAAGGATGPTPINSCGVKITGPGTYVLSRDIIDNRAVGLSQNCITIASSNVVFDGDGHVIDGNGVSDTTGIAVNGSNVSNVTVRDVTVSDWDRGLYVRNTTNGSVEGVNASLDAFGITLANASGITVHEPTVTQNLIGVFLNGTRDSTVENVTAKGNQVNVKVDEFSSNNTLPEQGVQWYRRVDVFSEFRIVDYWNVDFPSWRTVR